MNFITVNRIDGSCYLLNLGSVKEIWKMEDAEGKGFARLLCTDGESFDVNMETLPHSLYVRFEYLPSFTEECEDEV
jgi:hypothetical protein